jgi:hypothetical protein
MNKDTKDVGALVVMIATATIASKDIQKQSSWVTGGAAAVLVILLTKTTELAQVINSGSVQFAMYYLFAVLVLGVFAVPAHLFATVGGNALAALKDVQMQPNQEMLRKHLRSAAAPYMRWMLDRAWRDDANYYRPGQSAFVWAQINGHILILQLIAVVIAAGILIDGAT